MANSRGAGEVASRVPFYSPEHNEVCTEYSEYRVSCYQRKSCHTIQTLKVHLGKLMDYSTTRAYQPPCSLPPTIFTSNAWGYSLQLCNHGSENIDQGGELPSKIENRGCTLYSVLWRESTPKYAPRTLVLYSVYSLRTLVANYARDIHTTNPITSKTTENHTLSTTIAPYWMQH